MGRKTSPEGIKSEGEYGHKNSLFREYNIGRDRTGENERRKAE